MKKIIFILLLIITHQTLANEIKNINRVTLDKEFLFNNHLIITSYKCGSDGVYFDVYDRDTYKLLKSIKVQECDEEFQDNIHKVEYYLGNYYVLLEHRYTDDKRPQLVIISENKLTIINTYSANTIHKSDYIPKHIDYSKNIQDTNFGTTIEKIGWKKKKYKVTTNTSTKTYEYDWDGHVYKYFLINSSKAIFVTRSEDPYYLIIYLVDITNKIESEIFRVETMHKINYGIHFSNSTSNIAFYKNKLYFGVNRDLHIININNKNHKIIPNYNKGGFVNNGHGVDINKIDKVVIDEEFNRLLIFCFNGLNNSYLNIDEI